MFWAKKTGLGPFFRLLEIIKSLSNCRIFCFAFNCRYAVLAATVGIVHFAASLQRGSFACVPVLKAVCDVKRNKMLNLFVISDLDQSRNNTISSPATRPNSAALPAFSSRTYIAGPALG